MNKAWIVTPIAVLCSIVVAISLCSCGAFGEASSETTVGSRSPQDGNNSSENSHDESQVSGSLVTVQLDEHVSKYGDSIIDMLEENGYKVRRVDDYPSAKSLVVCGDKANKDEAKEIAGLVGGSSVLYSSEGYVFEGDILLIVGVNSTSFFEE